MLGKKLKKRVSTTINFVSLPHFQVVSLTVMSEKIKKAVRIWLTAFLVSVCLISINNSP